MRDAWTGHETWVYECLNCLTTWEEEFDVLHCADGHGGEAVVFEHDGQRCTTPWVDHLCPACASPSVKATQPPWGRHVTPSREPDAGDLKLVYRLRRLHAY